MMRLVTDSLQNLPFIWNFYLFFKQTNIAKFFQYFNPNLWFIFTDSDGPLALHSPVSGHLQNRFNGFTHPSTNGSQSHHSPPRTGTPIHQANGLAHPSLYAAAVQSLESPSSTTPNGSNTGPSNSCTNQTSSQQQLLSAALQAAAAASGSLIHHATQQQRRPPGPSLSMDSFYSQQFVQTSPSIGDHGKGI